MTTITESPSRLPVLFPKFGEKTILVHIKLGERVVGMLDRSVKSNLDQRLNFTRRAAVHSSFLSFLHKTWDLETGKAELYADHRDANQPMKRKRLREGAAGGRNCSPLTGSTQSTSDMGRCKPPSRTIVIERPESGARMRLQAPCGGVGSQTNGCQGRQSESINLLIQHHLKI